MIRITSKVDGFRRGGLAHSRKATDYPDGYFSDAQLAQLEAEPNLVVQQLPDGTPAHDDGTYDAGYAAGKADAERDAGSHLSALEARAIAAEEGLALNLEELRTVTKQRDDAVTALAAKPASGTKGKASS